MSTRAWAIAAACWHLGCGSSQTERHAVRAATYETELVACPAKSATLAESRRCRCEVATRYGRPCDKEP